MVKNQDPTLDHVELVMEVVKRSADAATRLAKSQQDVSKAMTLIIREVRNINILTSKLIQTCAIPVDVATTEHSGFAPAEKADDSAMELLKIAPR